MPWLDPEKPTLRYRINPKVKQDSILLIYNIVQL